jgi:tetratricopeptide (TPR) repeat protein
MPPHSQVTRADAEPWRFALGSNLGNRIRHDRHVTRLPALVAAAVAILISTGSGCHAPHADRSSPRVLRAGDALNPRKLELSKTEERAIEAHARFAAGVIKELEDAPEEALEHYRQAIANDPDNEALTLDVARKLVQKRRLEDARQLLERSAQRPRASGLIFGWLGTVHSLQGNPKAAIAANEEAIRRMPRNIAAYQNLARIYIEGGQVTNALAVLENAANQPDADSTFLILLADTLGVLHQIRDPAIGNLRPRIMALLDRAASLKPNNPTEIMRLADLFALMDERDKSLPLYLELLEKAPELPGLRERLAEFYLRTDNREKAVEQLRILSQSQPGNPLPHYYLGILALEDKKYDEAATSFNRVLALWPDNQSIYFDLAIAYLSGRKPADALNILDRARERFRPSFRLEYYTAAACSDLEDYPRAIRHFLAAEVIAGATDPEELSHLFYFQYGVACERALRYEDAAVQFERAIEIKPDFADALNYLGYMWAERATNLERAHELIERAVAVEPNNAAYLDSLAWVLHQLGRSSEALPHQLRAVELEEQPDPTLLDHLGDIYQRLGRKEDARRAWRRAQELDPKPEIEKKLRESE